MDLFGTERRAFSPEEPGEVQDSGEETLILASDTIYLVFGIFTSPVYPANAVVESRLIL